MVHPISSRTILWIGGGALLVGALVVIVALGFYPIALVNSTPVFSYQYDKGYRLAYNYYSFLNKASQQPLAETELRSRLRVAVLEGLIDEVFVDTKLKREMTHSELEAKIRSQVGELIADTEFHKNLASILKVSDDDIRSYFLEDQVKYQILEGQLRLEGVKDLTEWVVQQRRKARVQLFLEGARWNGDEVVFGT